MMMTARLWWWWWWPLLGVALYIRADDVPSSLMTTKAIDHTTELLVVTAVTPSSNNNDDEHLGFERLSHLWTEILAFLLGQAIQANRALTGEKCAPVDFLCRANLPITAVMLNNEAFLKWSRDNCLKYHCESGKNPCLSATCPLFPHATCRPYYCDNECRADFYFKDRKVDCSLAPNKPYIKKRWRTSTTTSTNNRR